MAQLNDNEEIDYLEVDMQIPGQSYCCLSFISPEKVLEQKGPFLTKRFLKSLTDDEGNVNLKIEDYDSKYADFISANEESLESEFHKEVGFKTSVRGIKVRGVYNTYDEASRRASELQRSDRSFNVFVGQVGYWLPWDPNADNVSEQQYLEKELNELMKNYKSNQVQKDLFYSSQVEEAKRNAAEDLKKKKDELEKIEEEVVVSPVE
tara:strand:- start:3872 stop:4492 length:621 start_codon:yes stop_codon:yes gene_type:complete